MSRTVNASIGTAEEGAANKYCLRVVASDELISFASLTTQATGTLDKNVPQSFALRAGGTYCYVALRRTDGTARLQVGTLATLANWGLTGGAQISSATDLMMRAGVYTDASNSSYVYTAVASGSLIQLKRQQINAITSDPPTISLANYGITFGAALTNTSALVRRVEVICPTAAGIVVAVGTHDFTNARSTIQFWLLPDASTAVQLDTLLQADLTETYAHWYDCAYWATFVTAIYDSAGASIRVIANAHPDGQSCEFSIRNGVETAFKPVAPVDPTYGRVTFRAASVSQVGSLFYLCGRITFILSDDSAQGFDCMLTSSDALHWSLGEFNFVLQAGDGMGALVVDTASSPTLLYYGGNGFCNTAQAAPGQGYNTATRQMTLYPQVGATLGQKSLSPNNFGASFSNTAGALSDDPRMSGGAQLKVQAGQWNTYADVGVFVIDKPNDPVTPAGRQPLSISTRDLGHSSITDYDALLTIDVRGRDSVDSVLDTLDNFTALTRTSDILNVNDSDNSGKDPLDYDVVLNSGGLLSKALNNPFLARADLAGGTRDLFMRATVSMPNTGDAYAIPTFALLCDVADDGSFLGVLIPKTASYGTKTKPRFIRSNLAPVDEAANTGGFNFETSYQALWLHPDYDAGDVDKKYLQACLELASHYSTEIAFAHAAGTIRDYVLRRSGRRLQLTSRLHDYEQATCAQNAAHTLVSEYAFGDDERSILTGRTRPGLGANTDAWAMKQVGKGLGAKAESTLTDAGEDGSATTLIASFDDGRFQSGDNSYCHVYSASPITFNASEVAHILWSGWNQDVTIVSYTATDAYSGTLVFTSTWHFPSSAPWASGTMPTGGVMVRPNAETWGYSGSRYKSYNVTGGSVQVNPLAGLITESYGGRAAFVTDSTVLSIRHILWTGDSAELISGNFPMQMAWDPTGPTLNSKAYINAWRMIMRPNLIYAGYLSDLGLPTTGLLRTSKREKIRYAQYTWNKPGHGNTAMVKWTEVPTFYSALKRQNAGLNTLTQYDNGTIQVGDDWTHISDITPVAGLRVEVTSKTGTQPAKAKTIRAVSVAAATHGGVMTLDSAIASAIRQAGDNGDTGDFSIIDGRAQKGTDLADHDADSALCYVPESITSDNAASYVTVSRYAAYAGTHLSVEDALRNLCTIAGVRSVAFRNLMTSAYVNAPYTLTLTTTPQALPLADTLSDFLLDMSVHLDATARLQIDFRTRDGVAAYYRLAIHQPSTGTVQVGLETLSTDVNAYSGRRWLDLSPALRVSGVTLGTAAADNVALRVIVLGASISVEINGLHVWTFNLAEMARADGTSYYQQIAYNVLLSYSSTLAGNSCSVRVPELWMACAPVTIKTGGSVGSAIQQLCTKYHACSRITADGGLAFAQFVVRDDGGAFARGITLHEHQPRNMRAPALVLITGDTTGLFFDVTRARAEGFSAAAQDGKATTTQEANIEAQLVAREAAEQAITEPITTHFRTADEIEDLKTIAYAPANAAAPQQSALQVVVTSIDTTFGARKAESKYKLRRYVAWQ